MDLENLKNKYKDEMVLCVRDIDYLSWVPVEDGNKLEALKDSIEYHGFFKLRYEAEVDEDLKQVIPYVVVKNKEGKYFVTKRIAGDSRLTGGYSLGLGGHVNPVDKVNSRMPFLIMDAGKTLEACTKRELTEETTGEINKFTFNDKAVFIDKSAPVSRVHVCKLIEATYNGEFEIKETNKLEGKWMSPEEIKDIYDKLEGWSKIACDKLNIVSASPFQDKAVKTNVRKTKNTRDNKKGKVR